MSGAAEDKVYIFPTCSAKGRSASSMPLQPPTFASSRTLPDGAVDDLPV